MVARILGKITEDSHFCTRRQRQQSALVFQQHKAFLGGAAGKRMMGCGIKRARGGVQRSLGVKHQRQQFGQAGVDVGFRDFAAFHRRQQLAHAVPAGGGHFQRGAVFHAQRVVVASAPVGDDRAVKAPFAAQDLREQMLILVGVSAIDKIVRRHNAAGMPLFDGDLKPGQVDFPQGALVHDGVRRHTPRFLAVDSKVLRAGGYALGLNAANIPRRQLARQIRVLGEILKAAPAQRVALHIKPRSQQHGHFLRGGFLAQGRADFLAQRGIPAVRNSRCRGEAGSRHAGVQPQVVALPSLLTQTVRSVRQPHLRNAVFGHSARFECLRAGEQGAFFLQGQIFQQKFCILHTFFPSSIQKPRPTPASRHQTRLSFSKYR